MSDFRIAVPYCAKCKKPVSGVGLVQHPMTQSYTLSYTCHDITTNMSITHMDMVNMAPHNTIIDFVEFSRVADDGQNLHT